jgi:hypothetical protein
MNFVQISRSERSFLFMEEGSGNKMRLESCRSAKIFCILIEIGLFRQAGGGYT